jgi:hypothetical protein
MVTKKGLIGKSCIRFTCPVAASPYQPFSEIGCYQSEAIIPVVRFRENSKPIITRNTRNTETFTKIAPDFISAEV